MNVQRKRSVVSCKQNASRYCNGQTIAATRNATNL
ncbi:hypothetical protein T4C_6367 [Trichinella pseudospiralis]|uniref:Uncharacterized protein n=1 Tax=Trichinella pseudospiralis TaxID=6337 RepID=A0A0V1GDE6_TRIPS|nr:hypothetical protein T4C_6367 [Trichinella pseudospiralis]